jgi:hypothetical protein
LPELLHWVLLGGEVFTKGSLLGGGTLANGAIHGLVVGVYFVGREGVLLALSGSGVGVQPLVGELLVERALLVGKLWVQPRGGLAIRGVDGLVSRGRAIAQRGVGGIVSLPLESGVGASERLPEVGGLVPRPVGVLRKLRPPVRRGLVDAVGARLKVRGCPGVGVGARILPRASTGAARR